jgi:hydrogenase nickel incorporation protein HypA/HybF
MHEQSLVRSLLAQVEQIAAKHRANEVDEVVIAVGSLAGFEPLLLASAFERLAASDLFRRTRLTIEHEPLTLVCQNCGDTFAPAEFVFTCPGCASQKTRVIRGEGVILKNVALRLPQLEEAPI